MDGARSNPHARRQPVQFPIGRVRIRHRRVRTVRGPTALLANKQQRSDIVYGGARSPAARFK